MFENSSELAGPQAFSLVNGADQLYSSPYASRSEAQYECDGKQKLHITPEKSSKATGMQAELYQSPIPKTHRKGDSNRAQHVLSVGNMTIRGSFLKKTIQQ